MYSSQSDGYVEKTQYIHNAIILFVWMLLTENVLHVISDISQNVLVAHEKCVLVTHPKLLLLNYDFLCNKLHIIAGDW